MVWLLIESNVLRKIVILPSSTLKVRPSIRWFHILSFTTLPSLKMGALPPWNPGCRFNQARYRGWSYPSASPPIHSHPFAELRILSDVLLQVRQKYPQYHLGKIPFWYLQTLSLAHFSGLFHFSLLALMEDLRHKQVKTYRVSPSNEILYPSILYRHSVSQPISLYTSSENGLQVIFRLLRLSGLAIHQRRASLSFSSQPRTTIRFKSLLNMTCT